MCHFFNVVWEGHKIALPQWFVSFVNMNFIYLSIEDSAFRWKCVLVREKSFVFVGVCVSVISCSWSQYNHTLCTYFHLMDDLKKKKSSIVYHNMTGRMSIHYFYVNLDHQPLTTAFSAHQNWFTVYQVSFSL